MLLFGLFLGDEKALKCNFRDETLANYKALLIKKQFYYFFTYF